MKKLVPLFSNLHAYVVIGFALTASVNAADRHVYLDTDDDGILNDCPNPAHNAKGTSNTDNLSYCQGGSKDGKMIGTVVGTVSVSACNSSAGVVEPVHSNTTRADVDRDGAKERVYGHPQACVYNMAKSDSCEIHAGTYRKAGAQCTANCGDFSTGAGESETHFGQCFDWNCWLSSVVAFGFGPNLDGTGYGTAANPGYMRGAEMNGSTDSWDTNGDKKPDGSYAAVISGDTNGDNNFDQTSCIGGADCTGDTYHTVLVGCGGYYGRYGKINCSLELNRGGASGEEYVKIDSDANGTFDTFLDAISGLPSNPDDGTRKVNHFVVKDIEFTGYNQGAGSTVSGTRVRGANFNLNGNGAATGLKIDHIYFHDYAYGLPDSVNAENNNAAISDMENFGCLGYTEIANSFLEQNNRLLFQDEASLRPAGGCSWSIHDNRIFVNVKGSSTQPTNLSKWKVVDYHASDGRAKQVRFWNNEVIWKQMASEGTPLSATRFTVFENFGNSGGRGLGEFWVYGNIFRNASDNVNTTGAFWPSSCSSDASGAGLSWRTYYFNNTWDGWSSAKSIELEGLCRASNSRGELFVGKNNVQVFTKGEQGSLHPHNASTVKLGFDESADKSKCSGGSRYFECGADPKLHGGLSYYRAYADGGLDSAGSCDPDADGTAGVDYDGDGENDTIWYDIAGHLVSCSSETSPIDIGAVQSSSATPPQDEVSSGCGQASTASLAFLVIASLGLAANRRRRIV